MFGASHPQTRIAEQNLNAVIDVIETMPNSLGRNERCQCGSGKKYKKCHG
ncbi:SEC-C metal-binding domain-containing protein [Myxococcus fulvus]